MITTFLRGGLRQHIRIQHRYKTWHNPLSKFISVKKPKISVPEVEKLDERENKHLVDLKHYTRSGDISNTSRKEILSQKLLDYIGDVQYVSKEGISSIDNIFNELYRLNNKQVKGVLSHTQLLQLFDLTSSSLLLHDRVKFPKFINLLIQYYMKNLKDVPTQLLIKLIVLGSKVNKLEVVLSSFLLKNGKRLTPDFTNEFIAYYNKEGKLNLSIYELLLEINTQNDFNLFDDKFYEDYIKHIESLYQDSYPKVHEVKDLDRNLDRVQHLTNSLVLDLVLENISIKTLLKILTFTNELKNSSNHVTSEECIKRILDYLVLNPELKESRYQDIRNVIFAEDLGDESLVETLLYLTWKDPLYRDFADMLATFVQLDDIKFSYLLRFQTSLYKSYTSSKSEVIITEELIKLLDDNSQNEEFDINAMFDLIMQSLMVAPFSARGHFTKTIQKHAMNKYSLEPSVYSFKYRIDKAIERNEGDISSHIFLDSLDHFIPWSSKLEPAVFKTLSDLIVQYSKLHKPEDVFGAYTEIRQHMINTNPNIESITAVITKLLENNHIQETIDILKKELPKFKMDSVYRLPNDKPYGIKYHEAFQVMHDFVINNKDDKTYQDNWVLYGDIHKYFQVPFETYLPAIKFFCEHDRLNAALIIVRQIKRLNELHGVHNNLPPLKEIYVYLFEVFGDKLYEEGVIEVHEYLKLDVEMQKQNLLLQNSILNAYANLQDVPRARQLFLSMSANKGRINEETIKIMIKAYTYNDLAYVTKLFNNLSHFGIIPNYAIYKQYMIAHVYHGYVDEAFQLVGGMKDYDLKFTSDTLLALHNYTLDEEKQLKVAEWAEKNHSEEWNKIKNSNLLRKADGHVPETHLIEERSN